METNTLMKVEEQAMTVDGLVGQVQKIQHYMEKVMKPDEHYGKIPGTEKPTLLKPGAEKLCLAFRLNPQYEVLEKVTERDFIAYTVKCTLSHILSQVEIASGIGSCNSRETKYRYRSQNTGKPVPKEYWQDRDPEVLGGPQYSARKKDTRWLIFEQIENDNPWDLHNTIIKMACKRALIAATLNATAASDIFTQDIEDMPSEIINGEVVESDENMHKGGPNSHENQRKAPTPKKRRISKKDKNGLGETILCDGPYKDTLKIKWNREEVSTKYCLNACPERENCATAKNLAEMQG